MRTRLCLIGLLLGSTGGNAISLPLAAVSAQTTSQGLNLTLMVPRTVYPRDALVRVTVTVQNASPHAMTIADSGGRLGLWVDVLNVSGTVVYSSEGQGSIPGQLVPPVQTRVLQPGQSLQAHPYIVLRRTATILSAPHHSFLDGPLEWRQMKGHICAAGFSRPGPKACCQPRRSRGRPAATPS